MPLLIVNGDKDLQVRPDNDAQALADAAQAMREAGLLDSPLGSNAWAFGRETTANGSGLHAI